MSTVEICPEGHALSEEFSYGNRIYVCYTCEDKALEQRDSE